MKKITKNNLSKKVARYSALSLAIAGVADASGQVNYTDVDPDIDATASGDEFFVDLDNDGTNEIRILVGTFNGNDFTAMDNMSDALSGLILRQMVGNYNYAINLAEGAIISSGAGEFGATGSLCYLDGIADTFCGDGNSTPDGFAGVSFVLDGNTHYGWVGLENVTASSFRITEYAYEESAGILIEAGDRGNIAGVDDNTFESFEYFVDSNKNLNLSANFSIDRIVMHNILGQQVVDRTLRSKNGSIDVSSLKSGIYVITASIDDAAKSFKIRIK
jgi:hypothetical protein